MLLRSWAECFVSGGGGPIPKKVHVRRRAAFLTHSRSTCKLDAGGDRARSGEAFQIFLWLAGECEGLKVIIVRGSIRLVSGSCQPARLLFRNRWAAGLTVQKGRFSFPIRLGS